MLGVGPIATRYRGRKSAGAGLQFRSTYPRPSISHIYVRRSVQDSGSSALAYHETDETPRRVAWREDARGIRE